MHHPDSIIRRFFCFFLPLSKCTSKVDPDGNITYADSYTNTSEMAQTALVDIQKNKLTDGASVLLAVIVTFFLPLACIAIREPLQSLIHFAASFLAGWVLYSWVFFFSSTPLFGGILAVLCWLILFFISLYLTVRQKLNRSFRKNELGKTIKH
jgi:hypothetical protein